MPVDEGVTALEGALARDPGNAALAVHLAEVLLSAGRPGDALARCREVLAQRLGDHPGARTAYERAGRIDVRSSDARERLTESARASVNGFAACFACWILAAATVVAFATDEPFAGIVLGGALVVAVALLVVWTRRRAARLTPAARALLRDQPWHRKLRIAGLPGAYWTLPAPLLLGVFSVMLVFSVFEGLDAGWDWPALFTTGAPASLVALTGRASLIVAEQMGAER
jgi:MFS family permease